MIRFMAKNLRTRLTVFYSVLLACALILYAVCVSAFYLHSLHEQMDTSLNRDVETIEGDLYLAPDGRVGLTSHEGEADEDEAEGGGYLLEVLALDGTPLYRSSHLNGQALGPPIDATQQGNGEVTSFQLSSGMRVRAISRRHHIPGGKPVIVRLAISEGPLLAGILGDGGIRQSKAKSESE